MRYVLLLLLTSLVWGKEASVSEATARLGEALKDSSRESPESPVALIEQITECYENAPAEEQKKAVRAIGSAARSKDIETRHASFSALGEIRAAGSSKYLRRWLAPPRKGRVAESYFEAINAAGRIADRSTLAKLWKLSSHRNVEVAVAATKALGGYRSLPTKGRKTLAMDLVRRFQSLSSVGSRRWGRGL